MYFDLLSGVSQTCSFGCFQILRSYAKHFPKLIRSVADNVESIKFFLSRFIRQAEKNEERKYQVESPSPLVLGLMMRLKLTNIFLIEIEFNYRDFFVVFCMSQAHYRVILIKSSQRDKITFLNKILHQHLLQQHHRRL